VYLRLHLGLHGGCNVRRLLQRSSSSVLRLVDVVMVVVVFVALIARLLRGVTARKLVVPVVHRAAPLVRQRRRRHAAAEPTPLGTPVALHPLARPLLLLLLLACHVPPQRLSRMLMLRVLTASSVLRSH
jgi:hypothetical protein